jgi:UV DNA damage endonuclease
LTKNNLRRIGFACKWIDHPHQVEGIKPNDECKQYNTMSTTVAWLNRQRREVAEQKLWDLMVYNIEANRKLVERVGALDDHLKMVRIGSDVLPCYTEPTWSYFWRQGDVVRYAQDAFRKVGDLARHHGVRLSMHPGQFTVLASDRPDVVERAIDEFEYHATMASWMGYGQKFQDFKINIHISGRKGPQGVRDVYPRLSPEARNTITIENEEISYGLEQCLTLGDLLPIVLDIHHHWIKSGGEYISPSDPRIQMVVDSWRGVRPTMHYSVSREDLLVDFDTGIKPNLTTLFEQGHNRQKLRAHSDFMWNQEVNAWALGHLVWGDIMVEAKAKNLASFELAKQAQALKLI